MIRCKIPILPHKNTPLIIIQWSCDPLPYDNIKDSIYQKRVEIDALGLKNASRFWQCMQFLNRSKSIKIPKKYKTNTQIINENCEIIRVDKNGKDCPPQEFFELIKKHPRQKRNFYNLRKTFIEKINSSINPFVFYDSIKNGNIVYLPMHAGHALDIHSAQFSSYTIPENVYVISFNPPNSQALFIDNKSAKEFLQFIIDPFSLIHISTLKTKNTFESLFYKNLRIWCPGDTIINRGLITDREQDLFIKHSGKKNFEYLKKSLLRDVSGQDVKMLYNRLKETYIPRKITIKKNKIKRNI